MSGLFSKGIFSNICMPCCNLHALYSSSTLLEWCKGVLAKLRIGPRVRKVKVLKPGMQFKKTRLKQTDFCNPPALPLRQSSCIQPCNQLLISLHLACILVKRNNIIVNPIEAGTDIGSTMQWSKLLREDRIAFGERARGRKKTSSRWDSQMHKLSWMAEHFYKEAKLVRRPSS